MKAEGSAISAQMIDRHYREIIENPEDVKSYWELTPKAIEAADVELELNQREYFEWPTDAKLKKLIWEKPLSRLAKDLGVSDNAIRKRCVKKGLELPKNGHWQRIAHFDR